MGNVSDFNGLHTDEGRTLNFVLFSQIRKLRNTGVRALLTNDRCISIPWAFGFLFQGKNHSLALQATFFKE